jgi:8-oxo-dGTP diphosphatase
MQMLRALSVTKPRRRSLRSLQIACAATVLASTTGGCVLLNPRNWGPDPLDHPAHPLADDQAIGQVVALAKQIDDAAQMDGVDGGVSFASCNDQGDPPYQATLTMGFLIHGDPDAYFQTVADAMAVHGWNRGNVPGGHSNGTTLNRDVPGWLLAAWHQETVEQAARRIVREKAGVEIIGGVTVLDVVSDPGRDERGHTVSIVVGARIPAGATGAVPVDQIPADMPFGHSAMVHTALAKVSTGLFTDPAPTYALLGEATTMTEVMALVRACDPKASESTIGSRLRRCGMYEADPDRNRKRETGAGRPALVFTKTRSANTGGHAVAPRVRA